MAHNWGLNTDLAGTGGNPGGGQAGCGELSGCYTVYAHGDHVLYHIDLPNKMIVRVGPFNAPMVPYTNSAGVTTMEEDTITDLAVQPNMANTIYVISKTNLYTADPTDGHVTLVGPVTACGTYAVALTFTPDGTLYAADYSGALCKIDITAKPPTVTPIANLSGNLAVSGDIVAVTEMGTGHSIMYATAFDLSDLRANGGTGHGTIDNNYLITIDPTNSATKIIGQTGYPKLFGVAFSQDKVFGFVHSVPDPTTGKAVPNGQVVTIDPKTGAGTLYNSFTDPMTGMLIGFAGAGVNSMIMAPPIM
jgi:hypothetical protein